MPGGRVVGWKLWGAVGIALVGVAAFGLVTSGQTSPQGEAPEEVFLTDPGPEGGLKTSNSPGVAVNPRDPDNVAVVNRVDRPGFSAELRWSADGGQTWSSTELPLPEGTGRAEGPAVELTPDGEVRFVDTQRPFAPDLAFAPDGTLYVVYANLMGSGNVPDNLWLARSDDGGATLAEPVRVAGERVFQARVAVDPEGVLHVTYLQADDIAVWSLPSPAPVVATRSEDGGETFTEPVVVSDTQRSRVGVATPVIDAAGDLVVLYQDFKGNVRDFMNLEGPAWEEPSALVVTRSTDGGRSFSPGVEIDDEVLVGKRFIVFLPEFPSLAAGPEGALYVAWADARDGTHDVWLRRSRDGGRTWSGRVRVNDNPVDDGTSQYLPAVSVSSGGRVDVLYLDRRGDPDDALTTVSLATSPDDGASFETTQVSSQAFDATVGASAQGSHTEPEVGSRLGLVSWEDSALGVWADTRFADADTDFARQDLVAARVSLPDLAALSSRRRWLVAVPLALLALVTVAGLVAGRRRRSRTGARAAP